MKKKEAVKASELIQRMLQLVDKHLSKMEDADTLSDFEIKLLPELLRITLAYSKTEKTETEEIKSNLANMPTEKLKAMLDE